jgi:tetratricopeptide (TPR) repeat protein
MANKKPTESDRRQAEKLACQAMEADDHSEALSLCLEAINFDPNCVDAHTIMASAFKKACDRVEHLRHIVESAEEQLGGQSYIEANKGDFWGLLETRPYMRARLYLAQTLNEAGALDEAITEYKALLELNSNDNLGVRYILIALYLETGDLDCARRLITEYADNSAVFAWSAVLERFLAKDEPGAQQMLLNARQTNPYVEDYLLGKKPLPKQRPGYYTFGDESEAIMCACTIAAAWDKYPRAWLWLKRAGAKNKKRK